MVTGPSFVPPLVLLIEDSPADVVLTTEAFEDARIAVDLVVATDGSAALALLDEAARGERRLPDLILLDLNLPRVHGLEVLERVKAHPALRLVPVVVMTTSSSPDDVRAAYERHANSFITKPIDPGQFLTVIRGIEDYWITIVRLPTRNRE